MVAPVRIFPLERRSQVSLLAAIAFIMLVTASALQITLLSLAVFIYIFFEWTTANSQPHVPEKCDEDRCVHSSGSNKVEMAMTALSEEIQVATDNAIAKAWAELRSMGEKETNFVECQHDLTPGISEQQVEQQQEEEEEEKQEEMEPKPDSLKEKGPIMQDSGEKVEPMLDSADSTDAVRFIQNIVLVPGPICF